MAKNVITDSEKLGYDDISQNGVKGPASSADNTVAAFDGATGKLLKDTNISLDSSGGGTKYLNDSGSYTVPAGSGDIVGPSSSVNNTIALFDGTTGKLLKASPVVLYQFGPDNEFLCADGTYKVPPGAGDVVGPSTSTDNHLVAFDGATGKLVKDSGVLIKTSGPATQYLDATGNYSVPSGGGGSLVYASRKFAAATGVPMDGLASFKLIDANTGSVSSPIKTALPSGGYTLEAGDYYISGVIVFNMHPNQSILTTKMNPNIWFTKNTSNFSIRLQQSMAFFGTNDDDGYYSMPFNVDLPGVTEDEFFSINVSCQPRGATTGVSCEIVQDSYFSIFKV